MQPGRFIIGAILSSALAIAGCGDDGPASSSPSITAPTIQSPAPGEGVSSRQPTLTVGNAQGASGLTYRFEVASDSGFVAILVAGDNIAEGAGGSTSWQVSQPLDLGGMFYWRASASAGGTRGPFSQAADFTVEGGFVSQTPVNQIYVFDPLTNGSSVGEVGGGVFNNRGWVATDSRSYIRYEVPPITAGFVEFQVSGLMRLNPAPTPGKRNLLIMWDPTAGEYTENPFRVHIAKYDERIVNRWHMRFRWISQGQERNTGINLFDWDPNQVYTFRLEWGAFPEIDSQRARVLLDGMEIMVRNYDPIYRPNVHWIELGMAPRDESLEQATYSNVTIGQR